jgi:hypothetical protein
MYKKFLSFLFFFALLISFSKVSDYDHEVTANQESKIYLPIIFKSQPKTVLLGLYPTGWMGNQEVIDSQLNELSIWSGKQITIAGTFIGIEDPTVWDINIPLTKIYENGYTPFINIGTKFTAEQFASGDANIHIVEWAKLFKQVVSEEERMAFIALMPEMNGDWVVYGYDPTNFIKSFRLIQRVFLEQGVPKDSVKWVFAPNGWSFPVHNFEYYYPGDEFVDVVGFSSYNFGYCGASTYWKSLQIGVEPYVERMQNLAPGKPIFLTQTGTSAYTSKDVINDGAKNLWLKNGYSYLANISSIKAIIYFNIEGRGCDFAIYRTWETDYLTKYIGYKEGIQSNVFKYFSPAELKLQPLSP